MTLRAIRPCAALLAGALALALLVVAPREAEAAARCFGKKATKVGTPGKDRLNGTRGRDVIVGLGGDDVLVGFQGADLLCGGPGEDTLAGVGGNDKLHGQAGFDVLLGMAGNDTIVGGSALDLLSFFYGNKRVRVRMGAGRAGGEGRDRFRGVENVEGSKHDDVIVGNKKKNLLNGAAGSDRLKGRGAADLFIGRTGNDKMTGGKGTDLATFFFSNGVDGDLAQGVVTGEGRDTLRSIENLEGSNKAPDRLVGNGGKNALLGETGRDTLNGGGGEDFIDGGAGNDHRLIGGGGNDFVVGGKGNDRMGAVSDAGAEDGSDFIRGEDGDDRLFGGGDGDLLEGDRGDDHFDGGDGFDFATFTFAPDRIVADLTANTATGWGNDTFAANPLPTVEGLQGTDKNDHLVGSALGNSLYGGKGDDELEALEDNDLLVGGDGDDDLDGGLGIDECRAGETETSCELPLPVPTSAVRSAEVARVTQPTISDMAPQVSTGLSTGTVTSGELPFTP